ncbi:MAG TPA: EamA family transporter [Oscillospiraceae bacterium]|nr:EamA family transporter [Oscillospiraceae bacterium]HPF55748.1 EamA family transporter [Clostridiales bacterium]HPK34255.1 EamA family transporter [Oscillospiraceae bacterium]HPR74842.1 EamA family transporter [Oscillospiraceae bacterium]
MNPLYLLAIFGLAAMATTKVTIQSAFGKKIMQTSADALFYNGMLFAFAAVIAIPLTIAEKQTLSITTCLYGAAFGILSIIFQFSYANAFRTGSVSLTVLINSFSLIIPILFCSIIYEEPLTVNRIIGMILLFISFFFSVKKDSKFGKFNVRWLIHTLICFFSGGFASVVLKLHQHTESKEQYSGFVLAAYIVAFTLSALLYYYKYKSVHVKVTYKLTPKVWIPAAFAGIILGVYQKFNLFLAGIIDSAVLFPIIGCSVTIMMTICGVLIFRDKLRKIQILGIGIGIISIALISM